MADELLDVIDENNNVIEKQMKSIVHAKGLRHRVSAILLKNSDEKYLIPTASALKVEAGGLFHSAAGHVPSNESYIQAAKRELWEETALSISENDLKLLGTFWVEKEYPTRIEKERFEVYLANYTNNMGKITLNEEQINEQWLTEDELRNIYLNNPEKLSYPLSLTCKIIFKFN